MDSSVLRHLLKNNKQEIESDGHKKVKGWEVVKALYSRETNSHLSVSKEKGGYLINEEFKIPYAEIGMFPRRAVLRVGMLLRDSEIAKEVRTQLLNIEEKTTAEVKVEAINEEDSLLLTIMKASSVEERSVAMAEYRAYTNRHVAKVEARIAEVETVKLETIEEDLALLRWFSEC